MGMHCERNRVPRERYILPSQPDGPFRDVAFHISPRFKHGLALTTIAVRRRPFRDRALFRSAHGVRVYVENERRVAPKKSLISRIVSPHRKLDIN